MCKTAQTFIDGRNIVESNFVYLRENLAFSSTQLANYQSFAGLKIWIGGALGKPMSESETPGLHSAALMRIF